MSEELILAAIEDLKKDVAAAQDSINDVHTKLFVGNGQTSLASQIKDNALKVKALVCGVVVIYTAIVGSVVALIVSHFVNNPV